MKRAPSYSDSFLIVGSPNLDLLTPILIPTAGSPTINSAEVDYQPVEPVQTLRPARSRAVYCFLFTFKGSFHLLLISAFETLFYFLYVNRSENAGILNTINTYYNPIVANCQTTWSNTTRWLVEEFLNYEVDQSAIDTAGTTAAAQRQAYNQTLLVWSAMYSVICLMFCCGATAFVWWKGWVIPWKRMLAENFMFVLLLGLYELFFFRTIIYQYDTISTAELNQYIVDGLARCANP